LAVDRTLDGADLLDDRVWIERGERPVSASAIASGPRVGIAYAEEWAEKPWRFWLKNNPFVSRPEGVSRNARGNRKRDD
jgi:DNA-3-methyladenine glycosylase